VAEAAQPAVEATGAESRTSCPRGSSRNRCCHCTRSCSRCSRPPVEETIATAHDDFDWSIDKRNVSVYNKADRERYDKVYEETFRTITDNEMIIGIVVGLTKTDAVINIGFKSDGLSASTNSAMPR
jgi:hypothetical protein